MKRSMKIAVAGAITACGWWLQAAVFTGAVDNDLAKPGNWDGAWSAADPLTVSPAGAFTQQAGLTTSADMQQSAAITFKNFPAATTTVDFGGRNLNTGSLVLELGHSDDDRYNYVDAVGGFTGVGTLYGTQTKQNIHFRNGLFELGDGFRMENWFPFMTIGSGAEVAIQNLNVDWIRGFCDNCSYPEFTIDGGTLRIKARPSDSDPGWGRMRWAAAQGGLFKIINGGKYIDESDRPQDVFLGTMSVEIDNGSILAENSRANRRNLVWASSGHFTLENGALKVAQFYTGFYQGDYSNNEVQNYNANDSVITFRNSVETFAFAPAADNPGGSFVLGPLSARNSVTVEGDDNAFTAGVLVVGGVSNSVAVTGGTFDVSNLVHFVSGDGSSVSFSGDAVAYLKTISADATALKSRVSIGGTAQVLMHQPHHWEELAYHDGCDVGGPEGTMEITGGSLDLDAHYLRFGQVSNTFSIANATMNGGFHFAAHDARAVVGEGATVAAVLDDNWEGYERGLQFDQGVTNSVLVISNGTFRSDVLVFKEYFEIDPQGSDVSYGYSPFTGCDGSRIEFRGDHPSFVVTSGKSHGDAGDAWVSLALGEMIDRSGEKPVYTTERYALDRPLRVRYVLPAEGNYVEAPIRNTSGSSIVLGGNAEFEFDLSGFDWPKQKTVIPLVYDNTGFANGGRSYIDVEGLNLTNADRLPEIGAGMMHRKAKLALSPDGKTLNLVLKGKAESLVISIR